MPTTASSEPIAIIGSGCRFPGDSNSPSKLWDLLRKPRDLLTPIPEDRFSGCAFYRRGDGQYHGHGNARHAYFLAGEGTPRRFDARFFGVSPAEANVLDPQVRLLLETVYEALESAGQSIEALQGSDTAVYAGTMLSEYERLMMRDEDTIGTYHATGTARALVSNRISYFFDWHGPSMTIDTACSSSLTAVHQAVQQLRTGQSRVAVAAGANLILDPQAFISFSKLGMLSPDGRSRMWDSGANGYARGEGVAALVLKTLAAAEADGDHIECIIREVGVNQDGKTPGLTMPSASAQASLIRDCYARAGLDLAKPNDRPQFFEAHGTGTPVGDPIEAEAIAAAFFSEDRKSKSNIDSNKATQGKLYVGSIKSVIGHTEGTAGLAALLKASLAVQNATIPPNLHFSHLNPKIERFYGNLQVPTSPIPWPEGTTVRRASVNSFGFGGANCHAIVEQYIPTTTTTTTTATTTTTTSRRPELGSTEDSTTATFAPFVFSAASKSSLLSYLDSFSHYLGLRRKDSINARDLAYTLHSRRSRLQISTSIAASTTAELRTKLEDRVKLGRSASSTSDTRGGDDTFLRPLSLQDEHGRPRKPKILGIFTGQGAQWARMGAELLERSAAARRVIEALDQRLARLPPADRPSWSLLDELLKDAGASRVAQAEFSQPLCTALQVLQVDMLRAAGVELTAVAGHSSGEIAAAYAAGLIEAGDAICIAYYRGRCSSPPAGGGGGQPGAMMAVESSLEDVEGLCGSRHFRGRVSVAAVNSPASVTVSGDRAAVERMQLIFQDEKKFARLLRVDRAYHSHHMLACSDRYVEALAALDIRVGSPTGDGRVSWFSSVEDGAELTRDGLVATTIKAKYWGDNLTRPVLFMQALQSAWKAKGPFDLAVEVGPHPALRSPALQSIQAVSGGQALPYTSLSQRGKPAIETAAGSLGFLWSLLGTRHVNLAAYDAFLSGAAAGGFRLVKGLPPYAWDHESEYWHESRYAKAERFRAGPAHPLLGRSRPDDTEQVVRWRNILRPREIPWLKGHSLQGQIVFPAAAYVVLALESTLQVCKGLSVSLIEVEDLELGKALTFDRDDAEAEAVFTLSDITRSAGRVGANFTYNATTDGSSDLSLLASGRVTALLRQHDAKTPSLPPRNPRLPGLLTVPAPDFYQSLEKMGYQYSGPFRALQGLERRLGYATGQIAKPKPEKDSSADTTQMLVHPAVLDAAFQSTFLARSVPFDGGIWTLHVPKSIKRVRVDPDLCAAAVAQGEGEDLSFDAAQPLDTNAFAGDVDIFPGSSSPQHAIIQVEGLDCVPFAANSAKEDREVFSTTVWDVAKPDAERVGCDFSASGEQRDLAHLLERLSIFYLRQLDLNVPSDHPARSEGPLAGLFRFASHSVAVAEAGSWPFWRQEWNNDSHERISLACEPWAHTVDVKLLRAIGDSIVAIATGERQAIEVGMRDNLLADYYQHSLGTDTYTRALARVVKQIVHRYPHSHILEVGAGTGGATKLVFSEIGQTYASYTFTDVSSGFFPTAQNAFAATQHSVVFKTLDINKLPTSQGFKDHSYDVVIASMVLHATECLEATLRNVRRLLRPGGFLVMMEGLPQTNVRYGAIFGAFPGWWAGERDGRVLSPLVDVPAWDGLLRKTGFGGCDTATPNPEPLAAPLTVVVAQAVDQRVEMMRDPLGSASARSLLADAAKPVDELVIVGSNGASGLAGRVEALLSPFCTDLKQVSSWDAVSPSAVSERTTILSLSDLHQPFFANPTAAAWDALRGALLRARTLLWATHSCRNENPHANMMVGLLRSAPREIPGLDLQFLDFADAADIDAHVLARVLLQLRMATQWQRNGHVEGAEDLLLSVEPEILLDGGGRALIPRLVVSDELNERYNSARRPIWKPVRLACDDGNGRSMDVVVKVGLAGADYALLPQPTSTKGRKGEVAYPSHSSLQAIRVAHSAYLFVSLGRYNGKQAVFLLPELAFPAAPWGGIHAPTELPPGYEADFLAHVSAELVASAALGDSSEDERALVLGASTELADVLRRHANCIGMQIDFATQDAGYADRSWIRIHPAAAERDIRNLLPKNVTLFIDLTQEQTGGGGGGGGGHRVRSQLPAHCRVETAATLFRKQGWSGRVSRLAGVESCLGDAVKHAHQALAVTRSGRRSIGRTLGLATLTSQGTASGPTAFDTILDWTAGSEAAVQVQPADAQIVFDSSKTYWLAGLSHGLGLSLCEWMVRHGARHVVISSRRPSLDPSWINSMSAAGAVVRVFACDVTSREEVVSVYRAMCDSMPPIGGVAQGAMVLDDASIEDMTMDQLLRVTRPKVEGSIHLEQLFRNTDLDFFVFFSSASAVVGYSGQANYSAANLFMSALAEQRRRRGMAASVINIGPVLGVGYIAQNKGVDLRKRVEAGEGMFISEQDFHQLFAEAVLAGRPRQRHDTPIEITTGVARIGLHDEVKPAWAANPIMSHYVRNDDRGAEGPSAQDDKGISAQLPIKVRLAQAETREQVFGVIRDAFIIKLAVLYQLPVDELAKEDPANLHLNKLGTDSLLATEIRSWFMKSLQVNIPVLKILSGASVGELITVAAETVPVAWIPKVQVGAGDGDHPSSHGQTALPQAVGERPPTPPTCTETLPIPLETPTLSAPSDYQPHDCDEPEGDEEYSAGEDEKYFTPVGPGEPGDTQPSSVPSVASDNDGKPEVGKDADGSVNREQDHAMPAIQKTAPLSFAQSMFWFVLTFLQDKSSLNHTAVFRLTGRLRPHEFSDALRAVCEQHETLRACFFERDGQPMQGILEKSIVRCEYRQIQRDGELAGVVEELEGHNFDLARGETLRVVLLALSPTTHFLGLSSHSLVVDGMSFRVFLKDLQHHYYMRIDPSGREQQLQMQQTPQYLDYAMYQQRAYETGQYDEELRYWRSEFPRDDMPDPLPVLRLGKTCTRPPLTSYENERADVRLGPDVKAQIRALCGQQGITPFHFHLAVFRTLLARYADAEDVVIGIGDANRTEEDMMDSIGPFVNLLPLRFRAHKETPRFDEVLRETRMKALAALANSRVPFQVLLNELGVSRSATCTPVFQCFVDYRLGQREKITWADDCQLEMVSFQVSKLAYDLALDIIDDPDGDCIVMLIVRKDLYSRRDAEQLVQSYERLVRAFVADPGLSLNEPEIFDPAQIELALQFGRGPSKRRTWPETMVHKIDEVLKAVPGKQAVRWGDDGKVATYSDLKTKMDRIADALRVSGCRTGSRVAVLEEPTVDWIASILAVMRLGAVYIPLDHGNPWKRLAVMVQDCQPETVLVDDDTEGNIEKLGAPSLKVINVSGVASGAPAQGTSTPISATASSLATILYTSGSSGTPKGILLKHDGFRNWLESTAATYSLGDDEVVLQQSSPGFDMSLIQVFTALCLGGTLHLVPRRLRGDSRALSEIIYRGNITYTFTCTSELLSWFRYGNPEQLARSRWRRAITGGEPGVDRLFEEFAALKKPYLRLYHAYGPTEISWTATTMELRYSSAADDESPGKAVPVGYPLPNYSVYVLDEHLNPVPPGVQGEIYVGGPGVAAGYLNNASLSAERFVLDLFGTPEQRRRGWRTMHRTGDLGRWSENGELYIDGRTAGDTQVKLRGLRIDLMEVERALLRAADGKLSEAVVSVRHRPDDGVPFLAAHVVVHDSCDPGDEGARANLLAELPARLDLPRYMWPAVIIPVEQMPLTSTLKLDRRAVAAMPLPEAVSLYQRDELSDTEVRLKALWQDVISHSIAGLHAIGPDTDFFHAGGTSLLLLDLRRRIQREWNVEPSLLELFNASTLASMARLIDGKAPCAAAAVIDWEEETSLTPGLLGMMDSGEADLPAHADVRSAPELTVVLTGATGYLGRGILSALISSPDIKKVHCLAVRDRRRLEDVASDKVVIHEGDLTLPRLGLSGADARAVFDTADAIIHNGADVSYLKSYASLRRPNVQATKELAEMSCRRKPAFHYVSSGGACSFAAAAGLAQIGPTSVSRFPPPADGTLGYASSKWASEAFLEKLKHRFPDWPVWIHRPSNISRVDESPQLDLVHNLQKYSREMGAVPDMRGKNVRGALDSVSLDQVVQAVVGALRQRGSVDELRYAHHLGGLELPMHNLRAWVDCGATESDNMAEISLEQWAQRASKMGMHLSLVTFLQTFGAGGKGLVFPKLIV